jgi:uncharacterized membrane protein SirB2
LVDVKIILASIWLMQKYLWHPFGLYKNYFSIHLADTKVFVTSVWLMLIFSFASAKRMQK